jgi:hypothetical protein
LIQETVIDFCEHVNVSSDSTRWGALLDYFWDYSLIRKGPYFVKLIISGRCHKWKRSFKDFVQRFHVLTSLLNLSRDNVFLLVWGDGTAGHWSKTSQTLLIVCCHCSPAHR